jgi:hypothetical protein
LAPNQQGKNHRSNGLPIEVAFRPSISVADAIDFAWIHFLLFNISSKGNNGHQYNSKGFTGAENVRISASSSSRCRNEDRISFFYPGMKG